MHTSHIISCHQPLTVVFYWFQSHSASVDCILVHFIYSTMWLSSSVMVLLLCLVKSLIVLVYESLIHLPSQFFCVKLKWRVELHVLNFASANHVSRLQRTTMRIQLMLTLSVTWAGLSNLEIELGISCRTDWNGTKMLMRQVWKSIDR